MDTFSNILEWILDKLKIIGAACLVGMTFLTCADVVGRLFRHPIFGSVEIVGFMATLTIAMALPYTHKSKGHVGVELLVRLLSTRTQLIIDICTGILSFALFSLVTWRMALYGNTIHESGQVSMNLELPIHVIIYITSFCFLIFILIILQEIINNMRRLKSK
jgi:TRAP-type C4-dicarboxylate transport system permease small subunit